MRWILAILVIVSLVLSGYLWLTPAPIDAAAYQPPPAPAMEDVLAPNRQLKAAQLLGQGKINGPEDVDVDKQGRIYGGTADGKIVRILLGGSVEDFAITGGRPLGMDFDPQGNLIVCDALKGLLSIDPSGQITVLTTKADNLAFGLIDDVDVARDGMIYFSDASSKYHLPAANLDITEARPHGRLLRYNPTTKITEVLLKDLYFANGVALSSYEDFVLVNETSRYRITRYWLKGPRSGTQDIFVDNLPGFPDGISSNGRGTFWLAMFTLRDPVLDFLHPRPWLKNQMAKLPAMLQPKRYGLVLALNENGEIIDSLQDPDGDPIFEVTSVEQKGDYLYLGSLDSNFIAKFKLDN